MITPDALPDWFAMPAAVVATVALIILKVRDFHTG